MAEGHVKALWRYPVLGMAGEEVRSTQIDARGVAGDRMHFAIGPRGLILQDDIPELLEWTATFPFNPDGSIDPTKEPPYPVMASPGGLRSYRWGDPRLAYALDRALGQKVKLARDVNATRGVIVATVEPDVAPTVAGINVHLSLRIPDAGWNGRELIFRDGVRLRLIASRGDGPGIETRVVAAGRIALNEPVELG